MADISRAIQHQAAIFQGFCNRVEGIFIREFTGNGFQYINRGDYTFNRAIFIQYNCHLQRRLTQLFHHHQYLRIFMHNHRFAQMFFKIQYAGFNKFIHDLMGQHHPGNIVQLAMHHN